MSLPKQIDKPNGLHQRYIVHKSNGDQVDPTAEYFVLRLDNDGDDPIHIKACRDAVLTYADKIKNHLPELSEDIIKRYS